ncbi:MAG TPA: metallophosphoesterase [Propioniciclava tarda]|nr:metallophosphoesterase [Propioniciclava tarda]
MLTRRRLLQLSGGVAALGLGGGAAYGSLVELHDLRFVRRPLPVENLPDAWVGRTIVQLTDVHVGPHVADDYLLRTFDAVARLAPDVLVITGDLTSDEPGIVEHAQRIYAHLPAGRLATLAILGNHDYGRGWKDLAHADRLVAALSDRMRFLRNESIEVDGLRFFGTEDLWSEQLSLRTTLRGIDPDTPAVGLVHNPDAIDLGGWGGYRGWVLSGHTHGGQVRPPIGPPPILPVVNRWYASGEFEIDGGRRLYVCPGVGHASVPIRMNCPPEVAVHTLIKA